LWIVPGALLGVLFPALSTILVQDIARAVQLYKRAVILIGLVLLPAALAGIAFAADGLALWLGDDFAIKSATVCRWLILGVFINSLAQVAFSFVQAAGRPDLTAKLHLAELPVYLLALWYCLSGYGIEGAALVWTLRVAVDTVCMFLLARHVEPRTAVPMQHLVIGALALATFAGALWPSTISGRLAYVLGGLVVLAAIAWRYLLGTEDRVAVLNLWHRIVRVRA
jgi:O-antigen/teichoic acid export membrane protein